MKEALIYLLVAASSLFLMSYTVHMFVGGMVEEETEFWITVGVVGTLAAVLCFMAWDIIKQRLLGRR